MIFRLWRRLLNSRFVRGTAWLAGGTAIGQALTLLASPLITRLYTADDLGRLGVYVAFLTLALTAASLRYESAIVVAQNGAQAAQLAVVSLLLILPTGVVAGLGLWLLTRQGWLGLGILPVETVWALLPTFGVSAAFQVLRYWLVRDESLAIISRVMVWQSVTLNSVRVGVGLLGVGWVGLVCSELLGRAAGVIQMARAAWRDITIHPDLLNRTSLREVLWIHRQFPMYALPSSFIDNLAFALPLGLIAQLYGASAAGYYTLMQRVLYLPANLIGASVGAAFYGRLAVYAREAPDRVNPLFWRTAGGLLALGLLPTLIIVALGSRLFGWVFGAEWAEAGTLAVLVAPWSLAQFIVSPLSTIVFVFNGQRLKFVYDVLSLAAVIIVLLIARMGGLQLVPAVAILSAANVVIYGIYFSLLLYILRRRLNRPFHTPNTPKP